MAKNSFALESVVSQPEVLSLSETKPAAKSQQQPCDQCDEAHVAEQAIDKQPLQFETQPALPPLDSPKVVATTDHSKREVSRGSERDPEISSTSGDESTDTPPKKLLVSSTASANPLRSELGPPLDPRMAELKSRLAAVLAYYRNWPVNTKNRSPWEVMHAGIAFGCQSQLRRATDDQKVTALGYLCFNGICEGDSLLRVVDGRVVPRRGPGLQGHNGQLLAILAQSKVKMNYPIVAYGHKFTIADLVDHEKRSVRSGTELTFQLIGLMHYLRGEEETWANDQGEHWSIRRMLRDEIDSPIRGAACGGTHRLMAISYAIRKREQRGYNVTGQYKRARTYIDQYQQFTFGLQNTDGSFSTRWFAGREAKSDIDLRMLTSGHTFEWLAFSLSDEQLQSEQMVRAAEYLTGLLDSHRQHDWKIGPLGHTLHGLSLYQSRVFNSKWDRQQVAEPAPRRADEQTAMLPKQDKAATQ